MAMNLFSRIFRSEMKARGLSFYSAVKKTGIPYKDVEAAADGRLKDARTAAVLCGWLDIPVEILSESPEEWKPALVLYTLNTNPDLKRRWLAMAEGTLGGKLTGDDVRCLLRFVEFKPEPGN